MFPWARRLEVSFECIGCHFCSAVMTFQGSSGPQKRGIMLLSKVIFSNNQIIVLLVVGSGLRQTPALQNIYCFSFVFISLLKMMLDEPFFFFFLLIITIMPKPNQWVLHALREKGQQLSLLRIIYTLFDLPFWGYKCWQVNIRAKVDQSVKFLFSASCSSTKCCSDWLIWF